jgi:hypothetical protein
MRLLYHVIRAKYVCFGGKALVEVAHRVYIESHHPVVCIGVVQEHPAVYLLRVYFELYHERKSIQPQYVVDVAVFPRLFENVADYRHFPQHRSILLVVVLREPNWTQFALVLLEPR